MLIRSAIIRSPGGISHWRLGTAAWLVGLVLSLIVVGSLLIRTADVALLHWYLLLVPLIIAAFRFGLTGAVLTSIVCVVLLFYIFRSAGQVGDLARSVEQLLSATTSPGEAQMLALRLADLRAADPQSALYRALMGLGLSSLGIMMLGVAVDNRENTVGLLRQAFNTMRRYFSPDIIDRILAAPDEQEPTSLSTRKEITLLFADLRQFTALTERMEAEDVARLLNDYFSAMTEEIHRHGGTIDKYLGDGIMAFFGDPISHPDHPERAFRAAIAMRQRMRDLHVQWRGQGRETAAMGIGIATGYAIVGNYGSPTRMEYTAIGSAVNVASRLSDLAGGEQILTTSKTYMRVRHAVEGTAREPAEVKGFSQPIEVVEILGPRLVDRKEGTEDGRERWIPLVAQILEDPEFRAAVLLSPDDAIAQPGLSRDERRLAADLAVLRGHSLFESVTAADVSSLLAEATFERYAAGTVVVRQGEPGDRFFVILEGDAVVTAQDESKREFHVASLFRGDCFGEVAPLLFTARTATVRTTSATRLLVLGRDAFYRVLAEAPTLGAKIEATARSRMSETLTLAADRPRMEGPASPPGAPARGGPSQP